MSEPTATDERPVLAVILARGGSKAVPGKNLQAVGGRTLVARAVLAARGANCVRTVVVSTDDDAIAAEAVAHGAAVVRRPTELADDFTSSESALLHAVTTWQAESGHVYRAIALLQATSPFTRPQDIDRVMEPILSGDADAALTVVDDFGYLWTKTQDSWEMLYQARARRQDRAAWKRESGNVYGVRCDMFLKGGSLFSGRVQAVTIPVSAFWEIDEPRDLIVARALDAYYRQAEVT